MSNILTEQQQLQQRFMRDARRHHLEQMAMNHDQQQGILHPSEQNAANNSNNHPSQVTLQATQPQFSSMRSVYDELLVNRDDYDVIDCEDTHVSTFESICQHGPLSTVQSFVSSRAPPCTRFFLHHGLAVALRVGKVDIVSYLLSIGAPITSHTPRNIISAPSDQQLPLFELLVHHGWSVNAPGRYDAAWLPSMVTNLPVLRWFIDHGVNPNLEEQQHRTDESDTSSYTALEAAAGQGSVEAVRLLLDAGANIQHGVPLHFAAGACPKGTNPHDGRVTPTKEFDESKIPIMALLVAHGADVNQAEQSRHMVPRYAIVHAVMAGAVERVRWLLEHGADAEAKGAFGSALTYATHLGSEEIINVIERTTVEKRGKISTHK